MLLLGDVADRAPCRGTQGFEMPRCPRHGREPRADGKVDVLEPNRNDEVRFQFLFATRAARASGADAVSTASNWWFRVAIHASVDAVGADTLTFEHPTMPGLQPGGWMERLKEVGKDPANPAFLCYDSTTEATTREPTADPNSSAKPPALVMTKPGVVRRITMDEVRAHNTPTEPWFIVHGQVYNGTGFLKEHPGGAESITLVAGEDATEDFMAIHSVDAKLRLADFHIGTLIPAEAELQKPTPEPTEPDPTFLSKTRWKPAELVSIERVNHDSRLYRFALEHEGQPLGLPTGQHVYARLRRKVTAAGTAGEGELVQRAYTPVSRQGAKGHLDLLIKVRCPGFYRREGHRH